MIGGVSDRLKSIPFFVAAAARSKRVFLIRWSRPAKLEEFLEPNEVNWSVPDWMVDKIENKEVTSHMRPYGGPLMSMYKRAKSVVLESLIQDTHGAAALYHIIEAELEKSKVTANSTKSKETNGLERYETIFHDLFRTLFKPSPPVQKLVEEKMKTANLTIGNYVSCHLRAFYGIEDKKHTLKRAKLKKYAINAVNCASMILPGAPVYFASDSQVSIDTVRRVAKIHHRPIATIHEDTKEALHLDKDWQSRDASEFYPTFVDLMLMANGRCTAYGHGGFGRFGALLSHDAKCVIRHNVRRQTDACRWTDNKADIETS